MQWFGTSHEFFRTLWKPPYFQGSKPTSILAIGNATVDCDIFAESPRTSVFISFSEVVPGDRNGATWCFCLIKSSRTFAPHTSPNTNARSSVDRVGIKLRRLNVRIYSGEVFIAGGCFFWRDWGTLKALMSLLQWLFWKEPWSRQRNFWIKREIFSQIATRNAPTTIVTKNSFIFSFNAQNATVNLVVDGRVAPASLLDVLNPKKNANSMVPFFPSLNSEVNVRSSGKRWASRF